MRNDTDNFYPPAARGPADQRGRAPSIPSFDPARRQRASSISSRLRAASDLEECGFIDKAQKGVFKDLIIAGDAEVLSALEKYQQQGDVSGLRSIIGTRRQSVDLLDGLDLEFLNVRKNSMMGSFDGDMLFDDSYGTDDVLNSDLYRSYDNKYAGIESADSRQLNQSGQYMKPDIGGHADSGNYQQLGTDRNMSMYGHYQSGSGNVQQGEIDMSAYESVAASLQNYQQQAQNHMMYSNAMNDGSFYYPQGFGGMMPERDRVNSMGGFGLPDGRSRLNSLDSLLGDTRGRLDSSGSAPGMSNYAQQHSTAFMMPQIGLSMQHPSSHQVQNYVNSMSENSGSMFNIGKQGSALIHYPQHSLKMDDLALSTGQRGFVGAYSPEARRKRIDKFLEKRKRRVWTKKVKYDVRKNFADSRLRVKGRFVKKEDEEVLRELLEL